ncbi:MAG: hypothetical protein ABEI98_10430 [Halorhabdus sp.]
MTRPTFDAVETEPVDGQTLNDRLDDTGTQSINLLYRMDRDNLLDRTWWTPTVALTGRDRTIRAEWEVADELKLWGSLVPESDQTVTAVWIGGTELSLDTGNHVRLATPRQESLACRLLGRYPSVRDQQELHMVPDDPYARTD